jgi:hypothetical protein
VLSCLLPPLLSRSPRGHSTGKESMRSQTYSQEAIEPTVFIVGFPFTLQVNSKGRVMQRKFEYSGIQ